MTYETLIDEPVKVWAFFDPEASSGQIFPIAINWRRHLIKFQKVIFMSQKRIGENKLINLVCASNTANFELEYDAAHYLWKLKKIMPQE